MRLSFIFAPVILFFAVPGQSAALGGNLADPVMLNIGLSCQWQQQCMARQKTAMTKSLKYVAKYRPPQWRIHLCNKNAKRSRSRIDWIGFDHCIRNDSLRPMARPAKPLVKSSLKDKRPRR